MKHAEHILVVSISVIVLVFGAAAEDWQWRRIAFEGVHLACVVSPPESSDVIYVTVSEFGNPVEERGVYKSVDSGQTWQYLPESNNIFPYILTLDPRNSQTLYCGVSYVHGGPGAYPRRSRDAGIHWEEVAAPLGRIVASPWQRGLLLGTGNAFGGWELYRSVDDGSSWIFVSSYEAPFLSHNIVFADSEQDRVFAGTYVLPTGPLALARSTDGGETWTPVLEGKICAFDQDPRRVGHWAAIRSNDSGSPGWFAESFDDGSTWAEWELTDNIHYVWQMEFDVFDSQVIYLWGPKSGFESLGIYRSIDGGHSWDPMNEGFDEIPGRPYIEQLEERPGELLAATNDGLWLWTGQQDASNPEEGFAREIRLEASRPCPFRETVKWALELPHCASVRGTIYSLSGSRVRNLIADRIESRRYVFSWDGCDDAGQNVCSGTYVLRIESGTQHQYGKTIKIR